MKKETTDLPLAAVWLLKKISDPWERNSIIGDFGEIYNEIACRDGKIRAILWFWAHIFLSIPAFIRILTIGSAAMLKNYFKIALRNIARQKVYSAINIIGLSIGLSFCILIYLYIADEFSFDKFHGNADRIYSVVGKDNFHGSAGVWGTVSMGPALEDTFPEIESTVRWNSMFQAAVRYEDKIFNEFTIFTDPEFFEVFSFRLIKGNPGTVLQSLNSIVLTENTAEKYFGDEDPLGKTLIVNFGGFSRDFVVTGVTENIPGNSSIGFRMLMNIENLRQIRGEDYMNNWWFNDSKIYVLLKNDISAEIINDRMDAFTRQNFAQKFEERKRSGTWDGNGMTIEYYLVNIKDLHLDHEIRNTGSADIKSSYILAGIAFLILFIACINFINLSIGRASGRAVEMGMRKVMGAERRQLIKQFWSESFLITLISFLIGAVIASALIPTFNSLAGKRLAVDSLYSPVSAAAAVLLVISVSVFAGFFPSLVISKFQPVDIIKGKFRIGGKNIFTRSLVVVQFGLSVFFIISTLIMTDQIGFLINSDPGFNKEGLIYIDTQESDWRNGVKTTSLLKLFKERIGDSSDIKNISGCVTSFNRNLSSNHFNINGEMRTVFYNRVYYDYLETTEIDLIMGRDFSQQFASDSTAIIVNKAFIDEYKMEDPIGKTIQVDERGFSELKIIGVVEDYNFMSLKNRIEPAILNMIPYLTMRKIIVKFSGENILETINKMEKVWKEIEPEKPFRYSFLDEDIERAYNSERRWGSIVKYSSLFAILITCMGIFGLTSIIVNRRIKEIGIRKVLGAGVATLSNMLIREFVILVAAAN
ncbi:MAG: FtsX-like permease family protein, partial [bacterium]|nr:FtsX-like permease family protein [bacterium]